jgi:ferrous iron transport protein B
MIGNPNSGKTTLFNALTGMRQKVGNYPGVTVEKKEGRLEVNGRRVNLLDLPGLYSLSPQSPDERIARDVLLGRRPGTERPHAIINVLDANNLERNLLLTSQLMDLGLPMIVMLTMSDVAEKSGLRISAEELEGALGIPVRAVNGPRKGGLPAARAALSGSELAYPSPRLWKLPPAAETAVAAVQELMCEQSNMDASAAFSETVLYLSRGEEAMPAGLAPEIRAAVAEHRAALSELGIDFAQSVTEARYAWIAAVVERAAPAATRKATTWSDRVDRLLMHKVWGYVVFLVLMAFVFQTIFTWANPAMDGIGAVVNAAGDFVSTHMPAGDLRDLIVSGFLGGVGTTLTFLPQILLLFFFIGLLEDTGYMARAAFLMDRAMSRVGLHGKSFIPLMSSFACAIPGVMAARTIDNRKARLVTILVAPLMSCSARLPVYALMIAATIPATRVLGIFSLPGLTLLSMYLLGAVAAFGMAWLFRKTLLKGETNVFLMELPPYRLPHAKTVAMQMLERTGLFVKKAGTVILAMSVVLWFLSTYPKPTSPSVDKTQQVEQSYAGRGGKLIEPLIRPLGFDWRIGISLITSFAAREVFVSSMATIYNAQDAGDGDVTLQSKLKTMVDPLTGKRTFTPLLGIAVMVYYVLAMQCISTIAVVRRETNSWKWPIFQLVYMTGLAWFGAFIVYQGGKLLGWG